jgi:hypothetical protein
VSGIGPPPPRRERLTTRRSGWPSAGTAPFAQPLRVQEAAIGSRIAGCFGLATLPSVEIVNPDVKAAPGLQRPNLTHDPPSSPGVAQLVAAKDGLDVEERWEGLVHGSSSLPARLLRCRLVARIRLDRR